MTTDIIESLPITPPKRISITPRSVARAALLGSHCLHLQISQRYHDALPSICAISIDPISARDTMNSYNLELCNIRGVNLPPIDENTCVGRTGGIRRHGPTERKIRWQDAYAWSGF